MKSYVHFVTVNLEVPYSFTIEDTALPDSRNAAV